MNEIRKCLVFVFLALNITLFSQINVSGTVTSALDGKPLPGVTISVKGINWGTTTTNDGSFSLTVEKPSGVLLFSFIGFKSQEVEISGRSVVNIVLEAENYSMEELVVVGYGSQIKSELTGSVTKLDGDNLQNLPVSSFQSKLQGKIPGVFISNTNGKLGEAMNIRVRGTSSITANNQPLYVIDGVIVQSNDIGTTDNQPINPLMTLDPKDIETIEVLKDASASAIYGSRASNGVVIITTRSGRGAQGSFINAGVNYSIQKETNRIDLLNAREYLELLGESTEYYYDLDPGEGIQFLYDYSILLERDTVDTDWQDEIFRTAPAKEVYINSYGGDEKSSYYAGVSYSDQQGIILENGLKRFSSRLSFSNKINNYVDFTAKVSLAQTRLNRVSEDNAFATPMQLIAQAPVAPAYLEDGEPNPKPTYYNSLLSLKYDSELNKINRTIASGNINIHIIPEELKFTSVVGADILNQLEENRVSEKTDDGLPSGKGYQRSLSNGNYTVDNYLTYTKKLKDIHAINATLGTSYQEYIYNRGEMGAAVFPGDEFTDLDAGAENLYFGTLNKKSTFLSYFGRINYKFNDRYLASFSLRNDGSSKFGADKRWGVFYAVSAGWILSRETFMNDIEFISFLKPRISYGTTGNANIIDYGYLNLASSKSYAGKAGLYPLQLGYDNLSWETTKQIDVGIDFGFFENRITGEIDYYNKLTEGLLLYKNIPSTNGLGGIYENVGEMINKGYELLVNGVIKTGIVHWSAGFNVAMNDNEVTNLNEAFGYEYNRVEEGKPLGYFYLPEYAGVDPDNGDALYIDEDGNTTNDYNQASFKMVGNPNPKYYGGLNSFVGYKGFDLNIVLQFVLDVDVYKKYGIYSSANADYFDNQTKDQLNRWQEPGDITDIPQARLYLSNGTRKSSRYVYDASYLRLKELNLGYNIPANILSKVKLDKARLYIATRNLLTFTKYNGFDPEVSAPGAGLSTTAFNVEQGLDYYSAPQAKTFTFGLDLTF